MMEEKVSLLGLPPIKSIGGFDTHDMQLALTQQESAKSEIIRIGDDSLIFKANMDSISSRAINSTTTTNKIVQFSSADFNEMTANITAITEDAKGSAHSDLVEEFNTYLIQMASQSNIMIVKMSTYKIAQELSQPILPPLIQQKPHGLFAKLLSD